MDRQVLTRAAAIACAFTALLTTGCGPAGDAFPAHLDDGATGTPHAGLESPDSGIPDVDVIRVVSPDEWPSAFAACLSARGFAAEVDDGAVAVEDPPASQREALDLARDLCLAEYPLDERYSRPLDDSQLAALYAYQSGELVECLSAAGYRVSTPPSEEVYIAQYRSGEAPWSPYLDLPDLTSSQFEDLNQTCPQQPGDLYDS